MLSNNLKKYIEEVDRRDPRSKTRRILYGLFLDISQALPRMRISKGLSQRELAKKLNTSHPTIARWETPGYTGYTLSKLIEVADALDFTVDLKFVPKGETSNHIEKAGWNIEGHSLQYLLNEESNRRQFGVSIIVTAGIQGV